MLCNKQSVQWRKSTRDKAIDMSVASRPGMSVVFMENVLYLSFSACAFLDALDSRMTFPRVLGGL